MLSLRLVMRPPHRSRSSSADRVSGIYSSTSSGPIYPAQFRDPSFAVGAVGSPKATGSGDLNTADALKGHRARLIWGRRVLDSPEHTRISLQERGRQPRLWIAGYHAISCRLPQGPSPRRSRDHLNHAVFQGIDISRLEEHPGIAVRHRIGNPVYPGRHRRNPGTRRFDDHHTETFPPARKAQDVRCLHVPLGLVSVIQVISLSVSLSMGRSRRRSSSGPTRTRYVPSIEELTRRNA